jgi:hypothetical protein
MLLATPDLERSEVSHRRESTSRPRTETLDFADLWRSKGPAESEKSRGVSEARRIATYCEVSETGGCIAGSGPGSFEDGDD